MHHVANFMAAEVPAGCCCHRFKGLDSSVQALQTFTHGACNAKSMPACPMEVAGAFCEMLLMCAVCSVHTQEELTVGASVIDVASDAQVDTR